MSLPFKLDPFLPYYIEYPNLVLSPSYPFVGVSRVRPVKPSAASGETQTGIVDGQSGTYPIRCKIVVV